LLDQHRYDRDIGSQILCACSGGSDSMALAVLLLKYGERLGGVGGILHFNHGWRGSESDADEQRVADLAREFSIPLLRGKGTPCPRGESPEAHARSERIAFFRKALASRPGARVWTAHHADDLAETLLWRILTGARASHGEGIRVFDPEFARSEVRPCLSTRKAELRAFLDEEGREWGEDRTNHEGDLLRARLRREALPALDAIFPKWRSHLVDEALNRQQRSRGGDSGPGGLDALASLLTGRGVRVRRAHLEAMAAALASSVRRSIDLEGGWRLTHEKDERSGKSRWILE
jgi:tRNA(Ile)-lysidine synthase